MRQQGYVRSTQGSGRTAIKGQQMTHNEKGTSWRFPTHSDYQWIRARCHKKVPMKNIVTCQGEG